MSELKKCPFCGEPGEQKGNRRYKKGYAATVGCSNGLCPAKIEQATLCGNVEDAYRHAENAWNRRADRWVKCSARMPTKKDGDTFGRVVAAGPTGTWALEWWAVPESIATRWCKLPEPPEDEP